MKVKMTLKKLYILIAISIGGFLFFSWQNNAITISKIPFKDAALPDSFNGHKILHISDLHNKEFGKNQHRLVAKIKEINPDTIFVTGDLIDSDKTDIPIAMELINRAIKIAPIYYVSGNNEAWSGVYPELKSKLEKSGVIVLDNEKIQLSKGNRSIDLIGLSDPSFVRTDLLEYEGNEEMKDALNDLTKDSTNVKILLSHRPELFDIYSTSQVNLVFSGHAHGGQFRLPFVGGLVAPDQGFFPKLTEGIHTRNHTSMVISRGLGNSIIPIRLFNRPELIVVTLMK